MNLEYDLLDNNAQLIVNDIRKKHVEQYKLIFMIVNLVDKIINDDNCKKYNNDREKYIIATVYDCYTTFSSEILLLERGLYSDYCILFRTFYEKKFKLFAVIKNKKNYNKLIGESEYFATDLAKKIFENKNNIFDDLVDKIDFSQYDFENYEKKRMSIESWANNASLINEYLRQYAMLSEKTHYGIGSLVEKLVPNYNETLTYSTFTYNNFDENIITCCYEMMECIKKFLGFINYSKFNYQIKKIDKQFEKNCKKIS